MAACYSPLGKLLTVDQGKPVMRLIEICEKKAITISSSSRHLPQGSGKPHVAGYN